MDEYLQKILDEKAKKMSDAQLEHYVYRIPAYARKELNATIETTKRDNTGTKPIFSKK